MYFLYTHIRYGTSTKYITREWKAGTVKFIVAGKSQIMQICGIIDDEIYN